MIKYIALAAPLLLVGFSAVAVPGVAQAAQSAVCVNPAYDQSLLTEMSTDDEDALASAEAIGNRCAPSATVTVAPRIAPRTRNAETITVRPLPRWLQKDLRPYMAS